jgi:hypothetical protein
MLLVPTPNTSAAVAAVAADAPGLLLYLAVRCVSMSAGAWWVTADPGIDRDL